MLPPHVKPAPPSLLLRNRAFSRFSGSGGDGNSHSGSGDGCRISSPPEHTKSIEDDIEALRANLASA
nr:hypothetical protein [Tanacetum cinerariifolium]